MTGYQFAMWLRAQGYEIVDTDWRKWGGATWVKARGPDGTLYRFRSLRGSR